MVSIGTLQYFQYLFIRRSTKRETTNPYKGFIFNQFRGHKVVTSSDEKRLEKKLRL